MAHLVSSTWLAIQASEARHFEGCGLPAVAEALRAVGSLEAYRAASDAAFRTESADAVVAAAGRIVVVETPSRSQRPTRHVTVDGFCGQCDETLDWLLAEMDGVIVIQHAELVYG